MKKAKILTKIDNFLSQEHLEKLCFLVETVLPYGSVDQADSILTIQRALESHTKIGRNGSIILLRRFLEIIGCIKFSRQLNPLIDPSEHSQYQPSLQKLYLYEILVLVCDSLGEKSFIRLKSRIPDVQLGAHRDRVKTSVQLFKRLLQQQTLSVSKEDESLKLLNEWLTDIGRLDIVQEITEHPRTALDKGW